MKRIQTNNISKICLNRSSYLYKSYLTNYNFSRNTLWTSNQYSRFYTTGKDQYKSETIFSGNKYGSSSADMTSSSDTSKNSSDTLSHTDIKTQFGNASSDLHSHTDIETKIGTSNTGMATDKLYGNPTTGISSGSAVSQPFGGSKYEERLSSDMELDKNKSVSEKDVGIGTKIKEAAKDFFGLGEKSGQETRNEDMQNKDMEYKSSEEMRERRDKTMKEKMEDMGNKYGNKYTEEMREGRDKTMKEKMEDWGSIASDERGSFKETMNDVKHKASEGLRDAKDAVQETVGRVLGDKIEKKVKPESKRD